MCQLLEKKIRLAESVKDSCCGQFQWVFSSHDNPGRKQPDEGYRAIDKVGPFNYKGLVTPWEEPVDAYYMYRANYVPAKKDPMVYIVSHTWADRFVKNKGRINIDVFSNCDSVKLYNDATDTLLMGKKVNHGMATVLRKVILTGKAQLRLACGAQLYPNNFLIIRFLRKVVIKKRCSC